MQRPQKSGFCEGVVDMDQYYTTGEFARMAHVTIRTIRYYDKKGTAEAKLYQRIRLSDVFG